MGLNEKGKMQKVNPIRNSNVRKKREPKFDETHIRFTNYFNIDLWRQITELRNEGSITNLTNLINEAVSLYIEENY